METPNNKDFEVSEIVDNDISINKKIIIDDPLIENPTIDREYSKPNMEGAEFENFEDIEEPTIKGKSYSDYKREQEDAETIQEDESLGQSSSNYKYSEPKFKEEPPDYSNPGLRDADTKTKRLAAEHLADSMIGAYVMLNNVGRDYAKTDMNKLQIKSLKGEFDMEVLNVRLPVSESDPSQTVSVIEFLNDINEQLDDTFVVGEEFKERARPLLVEILKKKGWGLTPEQQLLILIAEDAVPKIANLIAIKANTKYILDLGIKIYQHQNKPKSTFEDLQSDVGGVSQDVLNNGQSKKRGRPKGSFNKVKNNEDVVKSEKKVIPLLESEEILNEPEEN